MKRQTLAEQFKSHRKADYASFSEFISLVQGVDPKTFFTLVEGRVVAVFSDHSEYRMGDNA